MNMIQNIVCGNRTEELSEPGPYRPFKVTGADWMKLNEFCILTNMSLLFDFNAFLRKTEVSKHYGA